MASAGSSHEPVPLHQRGVTLIDVIGVMLLLSLSAAALLGLSSRLSAQSADALQTRQALAFSQAVLEEVLNVPFTEVSTYQGRSVAGSSGALAACNAAITLTPTALPGIAALDGLGQPQVWQVNVTVRCPGRASLVSEGLRIHAS